MSKTSELGFPALYRTLVAQPGQMQLFSPRAQPVAQPALEQHTAYCFDPSTENRCLCDYAEYNPLPPPEADDEIPF
tara:strand:+ start:487 stop:714 length:228 start_codon:yes stop_codon:yes gene_type:complete